MKLKEGFIATDIEGEQLMVATGNACFDGFVKSNKTAAFIVDCLKEETSVEAIVEAMLNKYDADRAIVSADVEKIISGLKGIGAIED